MDELRRFIEVASAKGISDDSIVSLLEVNGWSRKEIFAAMRDHYAAVTGVAVPVKRGFGEGARDAFLHLLCFGTLATWTIALGAILFGIIEGVFPDPVVSRNAYERQLLAGNLASLLVAFPVYLFATRQTLRDMSAAPEKRDSPIRRWLTWLALLIAASVVIGDAITVLAWLLRGEITARFLLKALVVAVLAGGVFWFYLSGLRESGPRPRWFAVAAATLALAAIAGGFTILGPPSSQRQLQADLRRVEHLREIAAFLQGRADLPESIEELPVRRVDPVSGQVYEYRKLGSSRYELCAVFDAADDRARFWSHTAGLQCFTLDNSRPVVPH